MARGWESKSVEDQMAQVDSDRRDRAKVALTPAEMERQTRRDGLLLARSRTLASLQGACDARYRALLDATLAHVEAELKKLDAE